MANKRIIELNERQSISLSDWLIIDDSTGTRKLAMPTLLNYLSYSAIMFVAELPTTDINPNMLYLVPHTGSATEFDEYVYRDNQWNLLGTSVLDLTTIYDLKPTIKTATLAAGATTVTFTGVPTTGDNLIDLYTSKAGLDYESVDDSTSGQLSYTFEAQSAAVTCYLVIKEV